MKRTLRARKAAPLGKATKASAVVGLVVALGTGVALADPALTVDVSNGSSNPSVTNVDGSSLTEALVGLAKSVNGVLNEGVVPEITNDDNGINIVLDPSSVPGLAEALAPVVQSGLSPARTGHTASGARVVFPTTGTYTSGFGSRWGAMHNGIDIAGPIGTPIHAVMDGTVIDSGPAQGFGNWIRIRHNDGSVSVYGHMAASSLLVGVGQQVTAGQPIAAIGNEGQSTGPHLHFEIHPDGTTPVDPQQWFANQGIVF